ncbi:MAG TPA: hypothetical protein ENJ53_02685 [Phaeodactylibacter sp.]|nr:hypothetical protein [Phaeodactylibacter sp.]
MSKINNPIYGKVGAFWIEGNTEPFYSLHEAKKYQYDKGGDILNYKGKVAIHDPEPHIAICSKCGTRIHGSTMTDDTHFCASCTPPPQEVKKTSKKSKGFFNIFGF